MQRRVPPKMSLVKGGKNIEQKNLVVLIDISSKSETLKALCFSHDSHFKIAKQVQRVALE